MAAPGTLGEHLQCGGFHCTSKHCNHFDHASDGHGLAVSGSAPKILMFWFGLPYIVVGVCPLVMLGSSSGIIFTWLTNFATTSCLVTWFGIGVTYLRFTKA